MRNSGWMKPQRHFVSPEAVREYFQTFVDVIQSTPSPFASNVNETRVNCPKQRVSPQVIVRAKIAADCMEINQVKDDAHLTIMGAISAFGYSTWRAASAHEMMVWPTVIIA
jgi:hypothetical protein